MAMSAMNSTMSMGDMDGMADSTMNMGNSTMDMGMDMSHEMHMFFYFGITNVTILFKAWTVNTAGEMGGACVGVFLLAMLYEGLKVLREALLAKTLIQTNRRLPNGVPLMESTTDTSQRPIASTMWTRWHILQTFLHLVQVSISYALMLIFMTYNGYLAISIIVGAGVGYFAFGWKKAVIVDINEHCH